MLLPFLFVVVYRASLQSIVLVFVLVFDVVVVLCNPPVLLNSYITLQVDGQRVRQSTGGTFKRNILALICPVEIPRRMRLTDCSIK